jgi:hypothetical protein
MCAEVLAPGDLATWLALAMHPNCALVARLNRWPHPHSLKYLFCRGDLEQSCGVFYYHPHDNRPETAIARRDRLEAEHNASLRGDSRGSHYFPTHEEVNHAV